MLEPKEGQFLIREVNQMYVDAFDKKRQQLEWVFPRFWRRIPTSWKTLGRIHNTLNNALVNGEPDNIEAIRYEILNGETDEFEEAYCKIENIPVKDETTRKVVFMLFIAIDRTLEVLNRLR